MRKTAIIGFIALATATGIYAFNGMGKEKVGNKVKTECCDPHSQCCSTQSKPDCSGN